MQLWVKILIALGLGVVAGLMMGEQAVMLKPIGSAFLSLINMIIVLLVLASMTVGVTSINDPKKLGRVGAKTLLLYLSTTIISICLGLSLAYFFEPGAGLNLTAETSISNVESPSIGEILLSIIPTNPISSMVSGNILQVIVFSLFLGIAISFAGEKGRPLLEFMESLADVMYTLTSIIMEFSPYGVFAIMAWVAGSFGIAVLMPLLKFLLIYYLACTIDIAFVFCSILWFVGRLHPKPFFKGMTDSFMVAFSTCSSSAALPVSMHCVQQNLGVSKNISSFTLPLGSTINMSGSAIFQAMAALFISQAYGIHLDFHSVITIVVTAVLSAVGAAGIPGTGFIMLSAVISSVGLPLEGLAILAGIDRVREMYSTVLNVLGDAVVAVTVAKQEGELDERVYYNAQYMELEESES